MHYLETESTESEDFSAVSILLNHLLSLMTCRNTYSLHYQYVLVNFKDQRKIKVLQYDLTLKQLIRINEKCILQSVIMSQDLNLNWQ